MNQSPLYRRTFLALAGVAAGAWFWPRGSGASAPEGPEGWLFRDNDFDSEETMRAAHQPIFDLAVRVLAGDPGPVLDLGSGNGALADRIAHAVPGCMPWGVELVPERAARSSLVCPEHGANFYAGDMFAVEEPWRRSYALVLLMPGRLVEATPGSADLMRDRLRRHARNLLVYAYPDWLDKAGGLAQLCETAGLRTTAVAPHARAGLALVL